MSSKNISSFRNAYPGKSDTEAAKLFAEEWGFAAVIRYKNSSNSSDFTDIASCDNESELNRYFGSEYCYHPEVIFARSNISIPKPSSIASSSSTSKPQISFWRKLFGAKSASTPQNVGEAKAKDSDEQMKLIKKDVLAGTKTTKRLAEAALFSELVPKLTARKATEVQRDFESWGRILATKDLELVEFQSANDLKWFINPVLEGYSVHTDDEYSVALDAQAQVAAIAVHNKGSMTGRVMIMPIWRTDTKFYSVR